VTDYTGAYTGDVEVGGPADTRELPGVTITKIATNPFNNNCYLIKDTGTAEALLVDAAGDASRLLEAIGSSKLIGIVETHGHWDHQQALVEVVEATGAPVLATAADAADLPLPVDRVLTDGDVIEVGSVRLSAITLVGHTPGSVALHLDVEGGHLFTGDSLFPGGVGNTEKDAARFESLITDVETKLFDRFPDSTWVYPGHGSDTTLGAERPSLAEWRERGW
jgi:glyoxylase-like metal-dependent hydrolase (beta-lactamase superfamily II)